MSHYIVPLPKQIRKEESIINARMSLQTWIDLQLQGLIYMSEYFQLTVA